MTVYQIIHRYETDGGYGDAIPVEEVIATFGSYEVAKRFVERYNNPHVYDDPYEELMRGLLEIRECQILDSFDENDEAWKEMEVHLNYVSRWYKKKEEDDDN